MVAESSPILFKRPNRVFYGWWVTVTLMMVTLTVYGVGAYGFTLFIVPLSDEFHWSRAIAGSLVAAFWFAAPLTPTGGVFILRFGVRRLVVLGCILEGSCFLLLPHAHQLWLFFSLRAVMGLGKILIAVCPGVVLNRWFSRHYAIALAIAMSVGGLGGLLTVPITAYLIETIGWRDAATVLGASLLAMMIPLALYVLRIHRPEELGLEKDGAAACSVEELQAGAVTPKPSTFSTALFNASRLPALWFLAALTICYYTAYNGLMGLMVLYVRDLGFSVNDAAKALTLTAGCALVGLLSVGFIIKAIGLSKSLFLVLLLFLAGVVGFTCLDGSTNGPLLVGSVLLFGIAIGCCDILQITFAQKRTSEGDFNHIYCVWYGLSLLGFLMGPSAVGIISTFSGGYHVPFVMLSCLAAFVFLLGVILIFGKWPTPVRRGS